MDMKKINIGAFVVAGAMLMTVSGCTDSDFDSKYEDPSKVNQVTISNLMVGVFQKVKIMTYMSTDVSSASTRSLWASTRRPSATAIRAVCTAPDMRLP